MDEILKRIEANMLWKEGTRLSVSDSTSLFYGVKRLKDEIEDLREQVRELEVENADAWAQVLHG